MEILNDILNLYYGEGRVYIFEYDENHTHQSCIYEVVSEGVSSEKDSQQNLPINQAKWWSKQILSGTPILLNSLNQLPEEAEDEYRFPRCTRHLVNHGDSFKGGRPYLGIYGY